MNEANRNYFDTNSVVRKESGSAWRILDGALRQTMQCRDQAAANGVIFKE